MTSYYFSPEASRARVTAWLKSEGQRILDIQPMDYQQGDPLRLDERFDALPRHVQKAVLAAILNLERNAFALRMEDYINRLSV